MRTLALILISFAAYGQGSYVPNVEVNGGTVKKTGGGSVLTPLDTNGVVVATDKTTTPLLTVTPGHIGGLAKDSNVDTRHTEKVIASLYKEYKRECWADSMKSPYLVYCSHEACMSAVRDSVASCRKHHANTKLFEECEHSKKGQLNGCQTAIEHIKPTFEGFMEFIERRAK